MHDIEIYAEYVKGRSKKFYHVWTNDHRWYAHWGRIGGKGQYLEYEAPSSGDARSAARNKIRAKIRQGYVETTIPVFMVRAKTEEDPVRVAPWNVAAPIASMLDGLTDGILAKLQHAETDAALTDDQYVSVVRSLLFDFVSDWRRISNGQHAFSEGRAREIFDAIRSHALNDPSVLPTWSDVTTISR